MRFYFTSLIYFSLTVGQKTKKNTVFGVISGQGTANFCIFLVSVTSLIKENVYISKLSVKWYIIDIHKWSGDSIQVLFAQDFVRFEVVAEIV